MFDTNIKSMFDLMRTFPTEQSCIDYLENIMWAGTPVSPYDSESKVYKCANNQYRCKNSDKLFNIKTGTFLENTKLPLQKWMLAIWLITSHKKGISSLQLSRDLDITQKSSWFMLQRIRAVFVVENFNELGGENEVVEMDETFVGGKNKNRHKDKKVAQSQGRSFKDKTPVFGMLQRNGKLTAIVVADTKGTTLKPLIKKYVTGGTRIITDEWHAYRGLNANYDHQCVDHGKKIYVNLEDASIHSNSIENSWKQLKTSYNGIYNWMSRKHMQFYINEFVYRFNMRKHPDSDKFNWMLANGGVRTKYKDLIQ